MYTTRIKNEYTFDYRKEKTLEGKINKFSDNATNYFTKITNNDLYAYRKHNGICRRKICNNKPDIRRKHSVSNEAKYVR